MQMLATRGMEYRETAGFGADCKDLMDRIRRCELYPDPDRSALARYVHRDPFKLEAVSRELVAAVERAPDRGVADLPVYLDLAGQVLVHFDRRVPASEPFDPAAGLPAWEDGDLGAHLDYVTAVLARAAEYHTAAFARLTGLSLDKAITG